MKKFSIYSFVLTLFMLVFSACEKDRAFPEFEDLEYGAYARLIDGINGTYGTAYNFNDVAGSSIDFTVEFYDENDGKNVTNYSWTASYAGGTQVSIASVNSSSFGTSPDGYPSASFNFTFQGTLDALGLTIDDVEGGKSFEFFATLTKSDGKVFTRENTSSQLSLPAYRAQFYIKVPIICPSELGGTFDATSTGTGGIWACTDTWTGTVEWENEGNGVYGVYSTDANHDHILDYSMGAYWACYGDDATMPSDAAAGDLRIIDACSKISYTGFSRWGEIYSFISVTVNGTSVVLDWTNDYDESAITTLVRQDGKNWPSNLRK